MLNDVASEPPEKPLLNTNALIVSASDASGAKDLSALCARYAL